MMPPTTDQPQHQAAPANPMSLALVRDESFQLAFEPTNFEQAWRMATIAAKIQLCGVKTVEEAFIRIVAGRELGLTTFQSLRLVYVVKGRPALDASFMHSLCLNHPQCEYFEMVESTYEKSVWRAKRRGRPEQTIEWNTERAKRAGLLDRGQDGENADKAVWQTHRESMLNARAKSELARIVFPDALNGIYAREELVGDDVVGPAVYAAPAASVPATVVDAAVEQATPTATPATTAPPAAPSAAGPSANARDFAVEAEGLREAIRDAKSDEDKASVRKAIKAFVKDGGTPFEAELKALYETTHAAPTTTASST